MTPLRGVVSLLTVVAISLFSVPPAAPTDDGAPPSAVPGPMLASGSVTSGVVVDGGSGGVIVGLITNEVELLLDASGQVSGDATISREVDTSNDACTDIKISPIAVEFEGGVVEGSPSSISGTFQWRVVAEDYVQLTLEGNCREVSSFATGAGEWEAEVDLVANEVRGTLDFGGGLSVNTFELTLEPLGWGVFEEDGVLLLTSPPGGGVLALSRAELPQWAADQMVTVGALAVNPGTLHQSITTGDPLVLLDGLPVARVDDNADAGGVVTQGNPAILVNGRPAAVLGGFVASPTVVGAQVPSVGGPIVTLGPLDASPASTQPKATTAAAQAGDTVVEGEFDGYEVGDGVLLGAGADDGPTDVGVVTDKGSIVLDRPLLFDHPAGTTVIRVDPQLVTLAREAAEAQAAAPDADTDTSDTSEPEGATEANVGDDGTAGSGGDGGGGAAVVVGLIAAGLLAAVAIAVMVRRRS